MGGRQERADDFGNGVAVVEDHHPAGRTRHRFPAFAENLSASNLLPFPSATDVRLESGCQKTAAFNSLDFAALGALRLLHVVAVLEVEPEFVAGVEVTGEAEGGIGGDAAGVVDDVAYAALRNIEILGEAILGHAERLEKFLQEDFARMDIGQFLGLHFSFGFQCSEVERRVAGEPGQW